MTQDDALAENLISEMLADPQRFDEQGKAYDLLQRYFNGFPVESLRPFLRSENGYIQRGAAFIASELGLKSVALVDDVIPLVDSTDGHTQWYAIEILAVCCRGDLAEKYVHVVRMLGTSNDALRALVQRLIARADPSQLEVIRKYFEDREQMGEALGWTKS